jgi:hypothetical protein
MKTTAELLDRLAKLLSLADPKNGGTEAECLLAMERAQKLMREHNLSAAQAAYEGGAKKVANEVKVKQGGTITIAGYKWEITLACAAANLAECKVLLTRAGYYPNGRPKKGLFFVGEETDVAVAMAMWEYLYKAAHALAKRERSATEKRSFLFGFAARVSHRSRYPQGVEPQALVLYRKDKADAIARHMGPTRPAKAHATRVDRDSFERGQHHGGRVDLGTKNRVR